MRFEYKPVMTDDVVGPIVERVEVSRRDDETHTSDEHKITTHFADSFVESLLRPVYAADEETDACCER